MINKVIYTGNIPQCPFCKKPTKRTGGGAGMSTLVYRTPTYDENGSSIRVGGNITVSNWRCLECLKEYSVADNGLGISDYDLCDL